ncbi:MAG: imidazole glycerol phosphate synthase subunit HisH [Desulfurivibrionaceae bacterium]|nr:imidazole glycerol phosphate synthase subunit HisH [Desulfurivibrionaceae bacterium]
MITLLDYGAGNVRSVRNAIKELGFEVKDVASPGDILRADKLIFPGVGNFITAIRRLNELEYIEPLREYLRSDRPFMGICLGLQTLFEGSEESPGVPGLGLIPGMVGRFDDSRGSVPQIGWNGINIRKESPLFDNYRDEKFYFVHSYRAVATPENRDWLLSTTDYGEEFISSVQKGNVIACQSTRKKAARPG